MVPLPPEEDRAAAEAELHRRADELIGKVRDSELRREERESMRTRREQAALRLHQHADELARRLIPAGTRLNMPVHVERNGQMQQVGVAGLDIDSGSLLLSVAPEWALLHVGDHPHNGKDA